MYIWLPALLAAQLFPLALLPVKTKQSNFVMVTRNAMVAKAF